VENNTPTNPPPSGQGGQVILQNVYIKDVSFETPNSPQIFMEMGPQAKPHMDQNMSSNLKQVAENLYEVTLGTTVTVKFNDKTAFLVEVHQAGIFTIAGVPAEQINMVVNTFCLNTLFPYLRESVSNLVSRGGFPPLYLPPIGFRVNEQDGAAKQEKTSS
jgi:preprotein translocase subunit SecB